MSKSDKEWEAEQAADTLVRAEEIKKDKPLFKRAMTELRKRQKAANKLLGKN